MTAQQDLRLQRDALARNLAARICSERRSLFDLQRLDCKLTEIERETDPIEIGLREIVANAPEPNAIHDRFDLGGVE